MNENIKYFAGAVAVVGLSIGAVIYISRHPSAPPPGRTRHDHRRTAPPVVPEEQAIKYPLPETEAQEPLPALNESDLPMQNSLEELIGKESVEQFVDSERPGSAHRGEPSTTCRTEKVAERTPPDEPDSRQVCGRAVPKRRPCSILPITSATNLWCN